MEKKYIEAITTNIPSMGRQKVIFDDVKNYTEEKNGDTVTHFEFDDVDGHYSFTLNNRVYDEDNDRAPSLEEDRLIGRRTARRHDLVNPQRNEVKPDNWRQDIQREYRDAEFMNHVGRVLTDYGIFPDRKDDE